MKKHTVLYAVFALFLAGLACNFRQSPAQVQTASEIGVAVALTQTAMVLPQSTLSAEASPLPASQTIQGAAIEPTQPIQPTLPSPTPTLPPSPIPTTAVPIPCDRASFVKDVTFPDGAKVKAGEVFNKTWTLKNNGSCSWTSGYSLVFERGDQMGAAAATNFTAAAIHPGTNVDVTVTLTAPTSPGVYQGFFRLKNASGGKFGIGNNADQAFWVKIAVEAASAPTIYSSGLLEIPQTWTVDLDKGTVGAASGADIHYQVDVGSNHLLNFYGPAKHMSRQPSYVDCSTAQMDSPSVPITGMSLGTYYCYFTDAGRLGFLEFAGFDSTPGASKLFLSFTTWNKP